ncbi:hypothetical protein BSL78_03556 [Apostichopus japonicus]|uniref:Uncharacterized protein n=1 Tax=Stichopus japonicus TaxID=307972 RepID=A0A2G8LGV9_STIJA|nr:hypothetical protein BSL78_03556 [Apostichopus japonicus]
MPFTFKVATENVWAMRVAMGQNYADDDSVSFKRALDDISSSESSLEADLFREGSPISSYQLVPVARFGSTITDPGVAVRQSLRRPDDHRVPGVAVGQNLRRIDDHRFSVRQRLRIWRYRRRTGDGTGRVDGGSWWRLSRCGHGVGVCNDGEGEPGAGEGKIPPDSPSSREVLGASELDLPPLLVLET